MYISKKKTYKILACAMSAIFVGGISGGVAFAEDEVTNIEEEAATTDEATTEEESVHNTVEVASTENGIAGTTDDSNNTVEVTENTITRNGEVTNYDGNITDEFYGGVTSDGNSDKNTVTVKGGTFNKYFSGGRSRSTGDSCYNFVTIDAGTFNNWVEGGWSQKGNANHNTVIINGGTFNGGYVEGGFSWGTGDANNNTVTINGGTFKSLIDGGWATRGNASYNVITINGGEFNGKIYGGYVSGSGNAVGNEITINGGKFTREIYSGKGTTVQDNVINIYGSPTLDEASIYAASGSYRSGNTIKIYTQGITAKDIGGFENLEFHLQADTKPVEGTNKNPILTLTNPTSNISSNIIVKNDGAINLQDTDTITLITTDKTSGLNIGEVTMADGVSLEYPTNVRSVPFSDSNSSIQSLEITVGDIGKKSEGAAVLKKQTEEFTSAVVDSSSLLDSGTERLLDWLPPEGIDYMNSVPTAGFDPFIGMGGSSLKIKTGNGTELKNKSGGINFGMTRYLKNRHGIFIVAPIIDHGRDEYDSTLDDGTKGSGHSQYTMGGLIARQVSVNGMYYEGSFRYGQIRTDFISHNFLVHGKPTTASYEASTPCYAGHIRIGWRDHISPQNIFDIYGMYSLNKVSGFSTKVSTGENYSFSSVNSGRMRIGARLTREIKERESVYSSIAYIHEFTGETVGEYMGLRTPRASLKGNAGLIELGWQIKPAKNSVAMLDTSISLWLGDRKGFTFATKLKKDF